MQSKDVQIGQVYWAKVSGRSVKVRIESYNPAGGWDATNLNSGRKARIKSVFNLDEIIEGRNVRTDRQLKKQQEQDRVKQIKAKAKSQQKTEADKVVAQDLKNAIAEPKVESKKTDRNRLPKSRKVTSIPPVSAQNIKPIRKGTKQQAIAEALVKGATIDDLCKATGWDRKSAHGQVHGGLSNRKGYGINQKGDKYYLIFPEGLNELIYA